MDFLLFGLKTAVLNYALYNTKKGVWMIRKILMDKRQPESFAYGFVGHAHRQRLLVCGKTVYPDIVKGVLCKFCTVVGFSVSASRSCAG